MLRMSARDSDCAAARPRTRHQPTPSMPAACATPATAAPAMPATHPTPATAAVPTSAAAPGEGATLAHVCSTSALGFGASGGGATCHGGRHVSSRVASGDAPHGTRRMPRGAHAALLPTAVLLLLLCGRASAVTDAPWYCNSWRGDPSSGCPLCLNNAPCAVSRKERRA
eukprot:366192-Chlamydomonas_euryale.AAC.5